MHRARIGLLSAACIALSACGGQATTEATGGSGGVSASGGSSSGTGANGGSGGTCATASEAPPKVGFDSTPGFPNAVVVGVDAQGLALSLGSDGSPLHFGWVGPDLTDKFQKGQTVGIGLEYGWSRIDNGEFIASARNDWGFGSPAVTTPTPYYGPELSYSVECSFADTHGACGQAPGTVSLLFVDVSMGDAPVSVGNGQTASAYGREFHNAFSVQYPGYASDGCSAETEFVSVVTALGPMPKMPGGY